MKNWSESLFKLSATLLMFVFTIFIGASFFGGQDWFKNIKAEITTQPYARTISVSAEGKITVKPDIAMVNLSVVTQAGNVTSVVQTGNEKMKKVVDAVKDLGIEDKDIKSTSYNLYPQYDYSSKVSRIVGYNLSQEVSVKIRDLTKVETILDAGLSAGANQIGQLYFDIDDASIIKKEAREQAFLTAREKAMEMCSSAGVKLGRVITFSEGDSYMPPVYANYVMDRTSSMAVAESAFDSTIESGSKDISINVVVTYEIE